MAHVQKIQHRIGVGRRGGIGAVMAAPIQPAAHQHAAALGVAVLQLALLHQRAKLFLDRIVLRACGHSQITRLGIRCVGAFKAIQHTGLTVSAGGQQFFGLFARKIVECIILCGLPCNGPVTVRRVVIVKICVIR